MYKRSGARQIDRKRSKKEKRLAQLRANEREKSKPPLQFTALEDGSWQVGEVSRELVQVAELQKEELKKTKFDINGFLAEVRSAISRRNVTK